MKQCLSLQPLLISLIGIGRVSVPGGFWVTSTALVLSRAAMRKEIACPK